MTYNNENAMVETAKDFILPPAMENDCAGEDFTEDYEGLNLTFPRVKIPGGGNLMFELPGDDPENPSYVRTIEGVILYNHAACAYWPEGSEYDRKCIAALLICGRKNRIRRTRRRLRCLCAEQVRLG